jgi:hypothetical protein
VRKTTTSINQDRQLLARELNTACSECTAGNVNFGSLVTRLQKILVVDRTVSQWVDMKFAWRRAVRMVEMYPTVLDFNWVLKLEDSNRGAGRRTHRQVAVFLPDVLSPVKCVARFSFMNPHRITQQAFLLHAPLFIT